MNGNASIKKLERNLITATLNSNNNALNRIAKTIQQQLNARKNTTRQRIIRNIIKDRYIHGNINALARNLANSRNLKVLNAASIRDHLGGKYVLTNNGGKTRLQTPTQAATKAATKAVANVARRVTSTRAAKGREMVKRIQKGRAERAEENERLNQNRIRHANIILSMIQSYKQRKGISNNDRKLQSAINNIVRFKQMTGNHATKQKELQKLTSLYSNFEKLNKYLAPAQSRRNSLFGAAIGSGNPNNEAKLERNIKEFVDSINAAFAAAANNASKQRRIQSVKTIFINSIPAQRVNYNTRRQSFNQTKLRAQQSLKEILEGNNPSGSENLFESREVRSVFNPLALQRAYSV
jgi:hypothetical protein